MNDRIRGLVLKIIDYKENDLILEVISEDKSFLSLIAKGAKKMSSKRHYSPLCVYEFIIDYKDLKTMYTIHNSKLIESFYEDKNLKLLSYKNIFLELTSKSKELYETDMYNNLLFSLRELNENNMYLLGSLYVAYLLKLFGIYPNVDECVICKDTKIVGISNKKGGFVCLRHLDGLEPLNIDTLKKFRIINKATYDNYECIRDIEYLYSDFKKEMEFFIENSDLNIKSYQFFDELFN
ncbi:MAG: DNA repair protein RecO [Erysipelotrichaceae bacterium]|nr:DNA repair protein RecO [Erysipelotrichaceae bacterium]